MPSPNPYQSPNQSMGECPPSGAATVLQRVTLLLYLGWPIVYWLILADWFRYIPLPVKGGLIGISVALALAHLAMQGGPGRGWTLALHVIYLFTILLIASRPSNAEGYREMRQLWRQSPVTCSTTP
jgi:hypothetical protein